MKELVYLGGKNFKPHPQNRILVHLWGFLFKISNKQSPLFLYGCSWALAVFQIRKSLTTEQGRLPDQKL